MHTIPSSKQKRKTSRQKVKNVEYIFVENYQQQDNFQSILNVKLLSFEDEIDNLKDEVR